MTLRLKTVVGFLTRRSGDAFTRRAAVFREPLVQHLVEGRGAFQALWRALLEAYVEGHAVCGGRRHDGVEVPMVASAMGVVTWYLQMAGVGTVPNRPENCRFLRGWFGATVGAHGTRAKTVRNLS